MSYIGIAILSLAGVMVLLQIYAYISAKKSVGEPAPELEGVAFANGQQLIYFHSAHCAACKPMTPVIKALVQEREDVSMVDARQQADIARRYNVRGTPTLVLVEEGKIKQVLIGAKSEKQIRALL